MAQQNSSSINDLTPLDSGSGGTGSTAGLTTNGQLYIGSTGVGSVVNTLTAGANITITNSAGGISIEAASGGSGVSFEEVTGSAKFMQPNARYNVNYTGGQCAFFAPTGGAVGDICEIVGYSVGGWTMLMNNGNDIFFEGLTGPTLGNGTITPTGRYASLRMINVAFKLWTVASWTGTYNFT